MALWLPGGSVAEAKTGQSPDCKRYCMSVKPREGPEGSVFRFTGRGWRPNRRVRANFGVYCRPDEACIRILNTVRLKTDATGRFVFRLRAGQEQPGDHARRIYSGGRPSFSQRTVTRAPRYRVILPN
jgi:hypothetical protein